MKLLSVTVPAYNMEKYLADCLNSFCEAGLSDYVEIIVVDDGSTDSTPRIADSYAEKHPEHIRVVHKQNGGHGSAVNTGIVEAKGRYFKIVDADDMIDAASWKKYLEALCKTQAELVATDFCCCDAKTMRQTEYRPAAKGIPDGEYPFSEVCSRLLVRMHSATWKTEILRDNNIRLDEHRYYVDFEYIMFPIPCVKNILILSIPLYQYRLGLNGQSVSIKSMQKNCESHLFVLRRLLEFSDSLETRLLPDGVHDYVARGAAELLCSQLLIYLSLDCSRENKAKITELENEVKMKYPRVFAAVSNRAVRLLRASGYSLYPIASALVRATRR